MILTSVCSFSPKQSKTEKPQTKPVNYDIKIFQLKQTKILTVSLNKEKIHLYVKIFKVF